MSRTLRFYSLLVTTLVLLCCLACFGNLNSSVRPTGSEVLNPYPNGSVFTKSMSVSLVLEDGVQEQELSRNLNLSRRMVDLRGSIERGFGNMYGEAVEKPQAPAHYTLCFEMVRVERQTSMFGGFTKSRASLVYVASWYDKDGQKVLRSTGRAMNYEVSLEHVEQVSLAIEIMLEETAEALSKKLQEDESLQQVLLVPQRDIEGAIRVAEDEAEEIIRQHNKVKEERLRTRSKMPAVNPPLHNAYRRPRL